MTPHKLVSYLWNSQSYKSSCFALHGAVLSHGCDARLCKCIMMFMYSVLLAERCNCRNITVRGSVNCFSLYFVKYALYTRKCHK